MTASFEIKINAIRTTTVGQLTDVIKRVEFTVKGTQDGQSFELPQYVDLSDPDAATFKPLPQVTEADVIGWVESHAGNMAAVKAHIQYVIDQEVAKAALVATPMPWAPAPVEPAPVDPAPAAA